MKILLIDYENVHKIDFSKIPTSYRVYIFVGSKQDKIPFSLVTSAQVLGSRLTWQKVDVCAKNALDFCLTLYLGRLSVQHPGADFFILSRDRGFLALSSVKGVSVTCIESLCAL